ncbi:MAG: cyclic nucleotide-binding domain-containing protein, partial [Leptospiraceae bacterium]|nr:cyclic nucleotide-binding domain-containing protein [Leptospiraceae bacterium]
KLLRLKGSWDRQQLLNPSARRLMFSLFWIALIGHWIAIGWIAIGRQDASLTSFENYLRAFYWTVTTLTTIGYGDITPQNNIEIIYTIAIMITGAGFYGFFVGNLASILANIDEAKSNFRWKLESVESFMKRNEVPVSLRKRVRSYYNYLWDVRKGNDQYKILNDLPLHLRSEVSMFLNRDLLKKVPLFEHASDEMLRELCLALHPEIFMPGDIIFRKGESGSRMYFISKGRVQVTDESGQDIYATLEEGSYFGEIALLSHTVRTASIRAADFCDLYSLDREVFENIALKDEDFAAGIREEAQKRAIENKKHREASKNLTNPDN